MEAVHGFEVPGFTGWVLGYEWAGFLLGYDLVVLGMLLLLSINAVLNAWFFPVVSRARVKQSWGREQPMVSVLVPARNEAHQIELCLESLRNQTYENMEVLVLDDCSEDGTSEVVADLGFSSEPKASRRLIHGQPLPAAWAGKSWACHQLSREAAGEFLLFTDADTVHHKSSVESAVSMALRQKTHLLSVWPHQITITWAEKLVIPIIYLLGCLFLPFWFLRLAQKSPSRFQWVPKAFWARCGAANGQFMLFTRDAYEELGGHERVKEHLVEDVAFGRALTRRLPNGWRHLNADGHDIVECRMYQDFPEVWEGFSKNLCPVFENRTSDFAVTGVILMMTMVLPFFFFFAREQPWLVALQVQFILLIRLMLTVRFHTSWLSLVLHPFAILLTLGIALNSWWLSRTGKITWKRREYSWRPSDSSL